MKLEELQSERERLKARNAQIVERLKILTKDHPERAQLVGEQTGINLRFKTLNKDIAALQREANGTTGPSGVTFSAGGTPALKLPSLTKREAFGLVAMHALITKATAAVGGSAGHIEDRAEDISEAAWAVADAMLLEVPEDEPAPALLFKDTDE